MKIIIYIIDLTVNIFIRLLPYHLLSQKISFHFVSKYFRQKPPISSWLNSDTNKRYISLLNITRIRAGLATMKRFRVAFPFVTGWVIRFRDDCRPVNKVMTQDSYTAIRRKHKQFLWYSFGSNCYDIRRKYVTPLRVNQMHDLCLVVRWSGQRAVFGRIRVCWHGSDTFYSI